jgi:hypothetical protein
MRFDLKTPCKNCPFRSDETAIRFACRERAEEIEESAYRNGFPCHLSADSIEDEDTRDGESGGFVPGENTQHCVGYIILQIKASCGGSSWPGIDNDEALLDRLEAQVDLDAPVFDSVEDYLAANNNVLAKPQGTPAA